MTKLKKYFEMEKIEKLEPKHLCGYLPHGLKLECQFGIGDFNYKGRIKTMTCFSISIIDGIMWKPLLLPLPALTELLEDGSVPIVELAKITDTITQIIECKSKDGIHGVKYLDENGIECVFAFNQNINAFGVHETFTEEFYVVPYQDKLFEYLYSIHADIYGLISAGLAIDKRTRKTISDGKD